VRVVPFLSGTPPPFRIGITRFALSPWTDLKSRQTPLSQRRSFFLPGSPPFPPPWHGRRRLSDPPSLTTRRKNVSGAAALVWRQRVVFFRLKICRFERTSSLGTIFPPPFFQDDLTFYLSDFWLGIQRLGTRRIFLSG